MGFLALFNAYTMRVCLSITIIEMAIPINKTMQDVLNDTDICPSDEEQETTLSSSNNMERYDWNESLQVRYFLDSCMYSTCLHIAICIFHSHMLL